MKKLLFIDRDGTLIKEPEDYQIDHFEKLDFLPGTLTYLGQISRELDYELVMITNQDGLGTDSFPEEDFWPVHNLMMRVLEGEGIQFREVLIDKTFPADNAPTRKPGTALLKHYLTEYYDLANSFVIGDRLTDMELAKNLGAKGIFINHHPDLGAGELSLRKDELKEVIAEEVQEWQGIYSFLKGRPRVAIVERKTKETDIRITLNLDGQGKANIQTGLGFFDHMLDQLARHGGLDLEVRVKGDLHVDEHHTIEDTALALGSAFDQVLGSRKGIHRYGFLLPMDESLAQVAIDFSGRPWLVWKAAFQREKVGDMPTELFSHFFKSFCDTARCTLNIEVEGDNEHHKIEAIFKAWAKAIRMAVSSTGDGRLPSTKGVL
jgi:imidazoleglycerol-phosphate dehydratase/histidinol-phosphatase